MFRVAEHYEKNLQHIMNQMEEDSPDNRSKTLTHCNLSIEEKNEIFLKVNFMILTFS